MEMRVLEDPQPPDLEPFRPGEEGGREGCHLEAFQALMVAESSSHSRPAEAPSVSLAGEEAACGGGGADSVRTAGWISGAAAWALCLYSLWLEVCEAYAHSPIDPCGWPASCPAVTPGFWRLRVSQGFSL